MDDLKNLPKLKPEIKERWLEALRSGKYKQTTGYLRDDDGFCCLGVLCDVVKNDKAVKVKWAERADRWVATTDYTFDGNRDELPFSVATHVFADSNHNVDALVIRNDGSWNERRDKDMKKQSFKQIANIIERHM